MSNKLPLDRTATIKPSSFRNLVGRTVLHEASSRGLSDYVIELFNNGADIKTRDCDGNSSLHVGVFVFYYQKLVFFKVCMKLSDALSLDFIKNISKPTFLIIFVLFSRFFCGFLSKIDCHKCPVLLRSV